MPTKPASDFPNTWEGVVKAALKAGAKYPELVAAQWALESGWGKHTSGKHNYLGQKGEGADCVTKEYVNNVAVTITDGFLNFNSLEDCIAYVVTRWYKDFKSYKGVNRAPSREAAARELQSQGYATDPSYARLLIKLMDDKAPAQKVAAEASKQSDEKLLFTLEATSATYLKKKLGQSADLTAKELLAVEKGKTYGVVRYSELPADAHAEVELAYGAGKWFVFEAHWRKKDLGAGAIPAMVDWTDFSCRVMPNLTVGEILQFDKRRTPGANSSVLPRLMRTALEYQKVREAWGRGLGVTSFYRPEPINSQVGGVPGSRHTTGEAMDIYPVDASLDSFYQWIRVRWRGGLGDGRYRGFIHLDTAGGGFVPGAGAMPSRQWTY